MGIREYDVILLGAYTKDTIVSPAGKRVVDGGGFNYGTNVVVRMGLKVASVTRLAQEDFHLVDELKKTGADVYATAAEHSTCLTLEYPSTNVDQRNLYVTTTSGSFTVDEVEGLKASAFVIGPSIRGEVPIEVIDEIKKLNKFISIDVQGYIRIIREDGVLVYAQWPEKEEVLSRADVLKTDAVEAEFLTGETDIYNSAKILASYGPKEIVLTHKDGLLVYDGKNYYEAGFYPEKLIGRSGRGDTVIASYMAKRINASPAEAAIWAAAAVSIKMEAEGPFRRNMRDVEELISRKYK
ncbi:MAG: putative PfkB domain protein [Clostridiales bacterium]|nr:putative PfkB domain protein [Clostridiales bacterium]